MSTTRTAEGSAILSGVAGTPVGRLEGTTVLELHAEVARGAAADAGVELARIDGLICGYSLAEPYPMLSSVVAEHLGIEPSWATALQSGGATAATAAHLAATLVESGVCRHVLVVLGDRRLSGMPRGAAVTALAAFGHPQFEQPFDLTIPAAYALVARRYMKETGTTAEDLAAVAVSTRRHAVRHPHAHLREPITLDDVAASRVIATPLRLLDCCPVSDGAGALLVSAPETAPDLRRPEVRLLGAAHRHTHEHVLQAPDLAELGCGHSARAALQAAGITTEDVDVAEVYDSFTITLVIELELMGFFERGEAGRAAAGGAFDLAGRLPCNTHGGLLSFGHPGAAGGLFHLLEAVEQLRGEAGERQVEGAEVAFVHGDGGVLSAHASLVMGRL